MNLKRVDLQEDPFTSVALVIVEDLRDPKIGGMVAVVMYSPGGNVIVTFKDGYDLDEISVAGEKFLGETLQARRVKHFKAEVQKV